MKKDAAKPRPRARARKKPEPIVAAPANPEPEPAKFKNVGSLESAFSLLLGVLFIIGAIFPRSIKQLALLGLGGGLVYRGMTSHCGVYQSLGLDSEKGSLLQQVNDKYLSGPADKGAAI